MTEVPSADDLIDQCEVEPVGTSRNQCYADLDKFLMEEAVPIVPWIQDQDVRIAGPRIVEYVPDFSIGLIALDQVALVGGGEEAAA